MVDGDFFDKLVSVARAVKDMFLSFIFASLLCLSLSLIIVSHLSFRLFVALPLFHILSLIFCLSPFVSHRCVLLRLLLRQRRRETVRRYHAGSLLCPSSFVSSLSHLCLASLSIPSSPLCLQRRGETVRWDHVGSRRGFPATSADI